MSEGDDARRGTLAPGVPPDYYARIFEAEQRHWWFHGTREIARALLGWRFDRRGQRLLDAGCGTGGFLRWALDHGSFGHAAGTDISSAAIELARRRVPEAEFHVGPLSELPFADGAFDLVVTNDVLQHVPEDDVGASMAELRRTLAPGAALLIRTNGARRFRRERSDWRAYDAASLERVVENADLRLERLTYANFVPSLWALVIGKNLTAPTETQHGIPTVPGPFRSAVALALLRAEARFLARPGRRLPYGHALFALAVRP